MLGAALGHGRGPSRGWYLPCSHGTEGEKGRKEGRKEGGREGGREEGRKEGRKEEIKEEIKKYLETNDNENTTIQN